MGRPFCEMDGSGTIYAVSTFGAAGLASQRWGASVPGRRRAGNP